MLPSGDREAELARLLQREVADTLGFDSPENVGLDRNFYEVGMDSLMMADLVGRLKKRVGISCSALVFDHPDVRSLSTKLLDRLPLEAEESPARTSANVPAEPHSVRPAANRAMSDGIVEAATAVAVIEAPAGTTQVNGYDATVEPDVFAFQAIAFPQRRPDMIPARWRWMFVESARRLGRAPLVWLHRDAGAIVAHMGSIPVRLKVGDEERDTGWLVDTMVLATHRNQAVGSRLMVDAHDDQPFSLSLGQTAEMREIQFKLGWKQVAPLQTAQLLVRPAAVLKGKLPAPAAYAASLGLRASATLRDLLSERRTCEARVVDRFDVRHDRLWANASRDLTCAVARDASYLNWKYVDQPGQQFLRLELLEGNELKGIAVWMFRGADEHYRYRRAFLVDLVTPLSDGASLRRVIRTACDAAAAGEADALLCHHIDARLTDALRDCGFHLRKPERFLLVDPGHLPDADRDRVLSAASWFVTQGDSDVDRPW
jgi:acyl carrier protein